MTEYVYTVHLNVHYEFGAIRGVFASADAAIAYAKTLDKEDEVSVTRWLPCDDPAKQDEVEVWSIYRGKVTDSRDTALAGA